MISFKIIKKDNLCNITKELSCDDVICKGLYEVAQSFLPEEDDVEYALSFSHGCALIRVFDMGRYLFMYPYEIADKADAIAAIKCIGEYAMREEIPFVISDVPKDELSAFIGYRHLDVDAEDVECESYRVKVKTECELLDEIPEMEWGRVALNALTENDTSEYARLSKDKNVNKYWGYNYAEDEKSPSDEYFIETARLEFLRGVSISVAVRHEGEFIGEAVFYAFDGMGGAEFAVRLLPEWWGRGLGRECVSAAIELGRSIGLIRLSSVVLSDNKKSHSMLDGLMQVMGTDGDRIIYSVSLV